jgi:CO/xanthine dehydrogenase Mo-binding subunit
MALPEFNVLGKIENHDRHTYLHLTGKADYVADHMPGTKLYGAVKHATIAHGTIKSIDASKALAEPGVKAVITYKETPSIFNSTGTILYWGQPVAGIVADDWYTALRAINLINVTYDVLPAITQADDALKAGAPLSGKRADSNIAASTGSRGDINQGIKDAEVTLETTQPWSTTYQHAPIECYQALAWWVGDHCYCYQSSANAHGNKQALVNYLAMPAAKVHVFAHGRQSRCQAFQLGVRYGSLHV